MIDSQADLKALLALCRADLCGDRLDQDAALPVSDAEWCDVLTCAAKNGLVGLLYRIVANAGYISPPALQAIRYAAYKQTARSCKLANELFELLASFRALDIKALPLKGPTLAVRAYGHISAREFCDLDILVPPPDLERAGLVLRQRGYRWDPRNSAFSERIHDIYGRDDGAIVELHWKLNSDFERSPIEGTGVWSRIQSVPLWDQLIPGLAVEDTLLFLCVHGFKHRWCRLKWITDIAYLVRATDQIDWEAVVLRARRTGCSRMLFVGLSLASGLLGSVLPPAIEKLTRVDAVTLSLADQIQSAMLSGTPIDGVQEMIYRLRARERFRDHFIMVCRLLPRVFRLTSEDGLPGNVPARTRLAAAFKRPVRLYRTFGLAWVKPVFRFR
jgi:hypothetical protein